MKPICRSALALAAAMLAVAAHAVVVTDERGVRVELPQPPQRIVEPAALADRIGLRRSAPASGWSASTAIPTGPMRCASCRSSAAASIRTSRPSSRSSPTWCCWPSPRASRERLEALGLKVLVLEPKSHADVRRVLEAAGPGAGHVADAQRVWRAIDASVSAAAQSLPARREEQARVLRDQQRALCGRRGLVHRRNAASGSASGTSCRPRSGPFPSSIPSTWCAPIPT